MTVVRLAGGGLWLHSATAWTPALAARLAFAGRRERLRAAVRRMIAWDPERAVMAHGRIYGKDGAAGLRRAFRWLL